MLEHISLLDKNHECEKPTYTELSTWLDCLFDISFLGREILVNQLENSRYLITKGADYVSVTFQVNEEKKPFPYDVRIPVEMSIERVNRYPVMFLLHIIDGYVNELEIYTADGSLIETDISLLHPHHQVASILRDDESSE